MPEISRSYGIVVKMYYDEHLPPHFHASYDSDEALIDFSTLSLYAGRLPARALGLVMESAVVHRSDLLERWESARRQEPLESIPPLP